MSPRIKFALASQNMPIASTAAPKPSPAAAVTPGAAFCVLACVEAATTLVATFVPEVTVTTLPVVAAEAVEAAATTELALAALKELCAVKLQRFSTSRTSLLLRSSASSSVSYCLTHASQVGRRVEALGAVQIQLFSPLSSLSK